jgi:hypothetical protein
VSRYGGEDRGNYRPSEDNHCIDFTLSLSSIGCKHIIITYYKMTGLLCLDRKLYIVLFSSVDVTNIDENSFYLTF